MFHSKAIFNTAIFNTINSLLVSFDIFRKFDDAWARLATHEEIKDLDFLIS